MQGLFFVVNFSPLLGFKKIFMGKSGLCLKKNLFRSNHQVKCLKKKFFMVERATKHIKA